MKVEKSCGAVVFTELNGQRKYAIICSSEGFYGFPKGHMEANETEEQTALREIKEETNLDVTLLDNFRTTTQHTFVKNGEERLKKITYFIGHYDNQKFAKQEDEISDISLMDYEEAIGKIQFDDTKGVLKEAEEYLNKLKKNT